MKILTKRSNTILIFFWEKCFQQQHVLLNNFSILWQCKCMEIVKQYNNYMIWLSQFPVGFGNFYMLNKNRDNWFYFCRVWQHTYIQLIVQSYLNKYYENQLTTIHSNYFFFNLEYIWNAKIYSNCIQILSEYHKSTL